MELKFDIHKTYAIALEGGGARGAYQVGAWRALSENGIKIEAVAGSSVGALNGAMMAMEDLEGAERLWNDMRFSRVMDVDDDTMQKLFSGKFLEIDIKHISSSIKRVVKDGGFDVTPLRELIATSVNYESIKNSAIKLYICTHSLTDRKGLELDAQTLDENELCDMLLASAYFPAFKHEKLGGKMYTDGGVSNVLPLSPLISRGYKNIIAIRLYGLGIEKKVKIPKNTEVIEIAPKRDLGSMLNFNAESCRKNYKLGYFDAMRLLYGLSGEKYYIDRTLSEKDAYNILKQAVAAKKGPEISLRRLHEEVLNLSKKSGSKGDYYDVFIALLEKAAEDSGIRDLSIYTDAGLLQKVLLKKSGII